jgi:hypothetical protein
LNYVINDADFVLVDTNLDVKFTSTNRCSLTWKIEVLDSLIYKPLSSTSLSSVISITDNTITASGTSNDPNIVQKTHTFRVYATN